MGRFFSNELFHFCGRRDPQDHEANFETLTKILASKCVTHPPHTPGWGETSIRIRWSETLSAEKLIVPSVVCFCDIPFEHLDVHLVKYGLFGLSFDKARLTKYGARPVTYIPMRSDDGRSPFGSQLLRSLEQTYKGFREYLFDPARLPATRIRAHGAKPRSAAEAISALDVALAKDVLAYVKPFNSELAEDHPDFYYAEREWRKFGNLPFEPEDVIHVVVPKQYVERLRQSFSVYGSKIHIAALRDE